MHSNSLILRNGKTILKGPFLKPVDSILQFPLDSIDSGGFVHNNKVIHIERIVQLKDHQHSLIRSSSVYSCYGLHPKHAMLYNAEEQKLALARVMQAIRHDGVIAIGKIGLDYFHANNTADVLTARERQRDVSK